MLKRHAIFLFLKRDYPIKTWPIYVLELFSPRKCKLSNFRFHLIFIFNKTLEVVNFSLIDEKLLVFMTSQTSVNDVFYFLTLLLVIYLFNLLAKSDTLFKKIFSNHQQKYFWIKIL